MPRRKACRSCTARRRCARLTPRKSTSCPPALAARGRCSAARRRRPPARRRRRATRASALIGTRSARRPSGGTAISRSTTRSRRRSAARSRPFADGELLTSCRRPSAGAGARQLERARTRGGSPSSSAAAPASRSAPSSSEPTFRLAEERGQGAATGAARSSTTSERARPQAGRRDFARARPPRRARVGRDLMT